MCGLVGMLTNGITSDAEIKLFKGLLLVDQLRGEHATGVIKVDLKANEVSTIKRAMCATDFLADQEVKDFLDKDKVNLYIGHNRYATMGDKGKHENAHPFQHDHITMVHNGGVDPYALDLLEGYNDKDVEVDSHMVCMTIAKHGAKKAITEHLAGAFALIWWDQKERTLNFIRNDDRPLWFAVTTSGAIVWASEKAFLDLYLERAGKHSGYRTKPILMPANELNTFEFAESGIKKGTGPTVTPLEFVEVHYPKYSGAAGKTWWESSASYSSQTTSTSQSANAKSTAALDNVMRINKLLEKVPCRLRYGSVVTCDVDLFEIYTTNKEYGNLEAICRDPKIRIKAWGLKASDMKDVKVVRGTISNAYTHSINGTEVVTIVMDKVGVSCHDPKYSVETSPNISTSHGDLEKKKQQDAEASIKEQKRLEAERNAKPRMRIVNTITYPLKVSGHTFQSAAEFREFVSKGCEFCSAIPEAYNEQNKSLTVYEGEGFNGLLEDCNFICGKCSEA